MQELLKGFQQIRVSRKTFGEVHENIKELIHKNNPVMFSMGCQFASVNDLLWLLLHSEFALGWISCSLCHSRQAYTTNHLVHF